MILKIKTLIIPAIIIYLLIAGMLSFSAANLFLAVAALSFLFIIAISGGKKLENKNNARNYIYNVPKKLVLNRNTLSNEYCIARYFPNEKIVVIDNPASKKQQSLRMFTVDKTNHADVNACWIEVCSVFDEYTYLDTLFSFIDKNSGSINVLHINKETNPDVVHDMRDVIPQNQFQDRVPALKKSFSENALAKKIEQSKSTNDAIIVDFDELPHHKITSEKETGDNENFIGMEAFTGNDKINVNFSDAQKLSVLPGINIVMAKKIVEYRNLNGFFKTKEDFFNVSGAKEHFKENIFNLITTEKPKNIQKTQLQARNNERTVD